MLELRKIWLTLKTMGIGFVVPILLAIASCAGALPFCQNAVAIAICTLCLAGFAGLFIGLFLASYLRYFHKITDRLCGIYIIGNDTWHEYSTNERRFCSIVGSATQHVYELGKLFGAPYKDAGVIQGLLKNTVVAFVDDIDEKVFNTQYKTQYKKIAGLCDGSSVVVEYNKTYSSLVATALEHELLHVLDMKLRQELPYYMWRNVSDRLGLDK